MTFGNVPITPGSGNNIAVDTVTATDYQRVKLVDGTEGGTQGIPGSLASGLLTQSAAQGAIADAAVTNPASSGSIIALLKGLMTGSGAVADAAVTNPASSASRTAVLKGILTQLATAATGLLKLEDAAHASGDAGVQILAVRTDTQAALAGTTGDYTALQTDALGAVRVVDTTAKAEDVAHVSGDTGIMALAVRRDTAAASSGTTGDYEPLQTDALGALRVVDTTAKAEDAAHTTGDTGIMALAVRRDTAAASSGTTGDYEPLQTDALGALRVVDAVAVKVGALTNATTSALAASLVVKASAGTLFGAQGYSTTAGFFLVHNTTTLPADAQVPVVSFPIEANKPYSIDFGVYGRAFSTGITVVFSSTGPTKTIGGSVMWVDAQYV